MNQRLCGLVLIIAALISRNYMPIAVLSMFTGLFLMFTTEHITVEEESVCD